MSTKNKSFIEKVLSEGGGISSKRLTGVFTLFAALGCIIYLTITSGATPVVENLLQTAMVMAACLLGISNVTRIWKDKK